MSALETFMTTGIFAFLLVFVRLGTAMMIMPGIGDSFVPAKVRLHMGLAFALIFAPLIYPYVPSPLPGTFGLFFLIVMEFIIGLFIGTIARMFMVALDTAGMVISISSGLGSAQVFNPSMATQGSLVGAFLSVTGVVLLFAMGMHHLLIMGLLESYTLFPLGEVPQSGDMAQLAAKALSTSFAIGVKVAAPFIILSMLIYIGMGVLSRLMPQIQVFLLALPLQILLSILSLALVLSAGLVYWVTQFEEAMIFFLSP